MLREFEVELSSGAVRVRAEQMFETETGTLVFEVYGRWVTMFVKGHWLSANRLEPGVQ